MARCTLYRRRQLVIPNRSVVLGREPSTRPARGGPRSLALWRFVDKAPAQVWATLLDEGTYLCSIRTMYRILEEYGEVRERRNQRRHPNSPSRSCWPKRPTRFGRANPERIRSFVAPSSGPTTTSTSRPRHLLPLRGWLDAGSPRKCRARPTPASPSSWHRKQDIEPDQLTLHADRGSSTEEQARGSAPG